MSSAFLSRQSRALCSERRILMKLDTKYPNATAAVWFSSFRENPFVNRV